LLPAVEVALAQAGEFLEEEEKVAIEACRDRMKAAIENREVGLLKSSVEELDHATESLAALLVEKATTSFFSGQQD
jgi:molecular chaperone DnaK